MKRILVFMLTTVCILAITGCGSKDAVPEISDPVSNPIQNADTGKANEEKNWSEQDLMSMFSLAQETDWEYIDCALIPDHASDRIGAVLFWDDKMETSNVAFFDADGYYQQCGTYAKVSAQPDFTYLGNGAVTFKLENDDGIIYRYTITISIDGSNVNFKAEDDLPKQQ
ncbi:MAG: lipoprotein [Oscillospiraceae bacterium]